VSGILDGFPSERYYTFRRMPQKKEKRPYGNFHVAHPALYVTPAPQARNGTLEHFAGS
jgi:hypothetical protein